MVAAGAVPIATNFSAKHSLFRSDALETAKRNLLAFAIRKHNGCAHVVYILLQIHRITPRRESETHRMSALFVEFRHKFTILVADVQASIYTFIQIEPCTSRTQIRHHNVTRSGKIHIAARMLCAAQRRFRFLQSFVERKLVRFGQSHLTVTAQVACATQPAH